MIRGIPRNTIDITTPSMKIPMLVDNEKEHSHIEVLQRNIMKLHQDQLQLSDELRKTLFEST